MLSIHLALSILLASLVCSYWGIYFLLKYLKNNNILDIPNERSNHKTPTPRGAGIALIVTMILLWPAFGVFFTSSLLYNSIITLLTVVLAVISFIDDRNSISALKRLSVHLIVSSIMVYFLMPNRNLILPDVIPFYIEKLVITILLTYFINAYNFMDGIDGISGINTITVLLGMSVLGYIGGIAEIYIYMASLIIGFCLAFLIFNWYPAKIFLGDVGSIPLGFLVGTMGLYLAYNGYLAEVILINGYYIFDTSYTMLMRLKNKENIFEPHSKHIYQRLVRTKKLNVKRTSLGIGMVNIVLSGIAVLYFYIIYYIKI